MMVFMVSTSCSLSSYLRPHEQLLHQVKIKDAPPEYEEPLSSLVLQKPNRRILGIFRYHMWRYVVTNATQRKLLRKESSNVKGEPPVILDTNRHLVTARKMADFLLNKGYLNAQVDFKVKSGSGLDTWRELVYNTFAPNRFVVLPFYNRRKVYELSAARIRKRATVAYRIQEGKRYKVRKIKYFIADREVDRVVRESADKRVIQTGLFYNSQYLKDERKRISGILRRHGYYNFNKEFIFFDVDTSVAGQLVDVGIRIKNPSDSTRHQKIRIDSIFIESSPDFAVTSLAGDTTVAGVTFRQGPQPIKPRALRRYIVIEPEAQYDERDMQNTLSRLSELEVVRFVDMRLINPRRIAENKVAYHVIFTLTPNKKKLISWDAEATSSEVGNQANTQGRFYGVGSSVNYRNQNFLQRAWKYKLRLSGALEYGSDTLSNLRLDNLSGLQLNQANSRISLSQSITIPKLLGLDKLDNGTEINETNLNIAGTLERSLQFNARRSLDASFQWIVHNNINTQYITPFQITLVSTENSPQFQKLLDDTSADSRLDASVRRFFNTNRYVFTFSRYNFIYNGKIAARDNAPYWFVSYAPLESSGSLLHWAEQAFPESTGRRDTLLGVPYFRYLKTDLDVRRYYPGGSGGQWVFRFSVGYALSLPLSGGLSTLPFEKRYFIGGSNSIRAWRARSLGPGKYEDDQPTGINQSGDFRLLANAEYRFPIFGFTKGAIFLDAGNVWQNKLSDGQSNELARINEPFLLQQLTEEIAIGTGFGLRFDTDFFIFRLDLGLRVHDPANRLEDKQPAWILRKANFGPWTDDNMRLNLGIGYPF